MLKTIELGRVLTKNEMKTVKGGNCCAHNADWGFSNCTYTTLAAAQAAADYYASTSGQRGFYCCDNCWQTPNPE